MAALLSFFCDISAVGGLALYQQFTLSTT